MRILLITHHFPPDPAVGAVRAGQVAAALAEAGHDVRVLAPAASAPGGHGASDRIEVRAVPNRLDLRAMYMRFRNGGRRPPETGGGRDVLARPADWAPPAGVPRWKRWLFSLIWLPDDRQGWIPSVVAEARRYARNRQVDLIITTAPPFSTHLAGLAIKRLSGIPWIAEFRDPWVGNPWKPAHVRSRGTDAIEAKLERRCLKAADAVIAVTERAARGMSERGAGRVEVIRTGIPQAGDARQHVAQNGCLEIMYAGTLYHRRDPRPFLSALSTLRAAGRLKPVRVTFVGDCSHYGGDDLRDLCERLGIGDLVTFPGKLPREDCLARMHAADLLLLLAQDQPAQVPQKLYEYLATGRRVIAFADEDGETAHMLTSLGGHCVIAADAAPADVSRGIETAMVLNGGSTMNTGLLQEWSTREQMARLVRLAEEVAA